MKVDRGVKECNFSGKGNAVIIPSACHQLTNPPFLHSVIKEKRKRGGKKERKGVRVTV